MLITSLLLLFCNDLSSAFLNSVNYVKTKMLLVLLPCSDPVTSGPFYRLNCTKIAENTETPILQTLEQQGEKEIVNGNQTLRNKHQRKQLLAATSSAYPGHSLT